MNAMKQIWENWGRDAGWGLFLYALAMIALFFILAQGEADFIYAAF